jgi:hypothetical protein
LAGAKELAASERRRKNEKNISAEEDSQKKGTWLQKENVR